MSKDLSYLDDITKNALKDVKITSDVSWDNFSTKMKGGQNSSFANSSQAVSKISSFFSSKIAIIVSVVFTVTSVTLLVFTNVTNDFKASIKSHKIEMPKNNKIKNDKVFVVINNAELKEDVKDANIVEVKNNNETENIILSENENIDKKIDSTKNPVVVVKRVRKVVIDSNNIKVEKP